jgi:hypothetical protein
LIIYEKPTGDKKGTKRLAQVMWPTGLSVLPAGMGLDGESFILMKYFHGFLRGEREGAQALIAKRGK